ncbi:MAG: lectin like domain-containing protein, partial [Elusimicrobiales bacterium]|nr:lectin like domain-containing protein [Elusimicrobiales bacterium]
PVDLSHTAGTDISASLRRSFSPAALPSSGYAPTYDLRAIGKVTPVKDQGANGNCWAYATYASLESSLLTAENWDFNEYRMSTTHDFDWGINDGGNASMSAAYLTRWSGPMTEGQSSPVRKHLQGMTWLPTAAGPNEAAYKNNVKAALTSRGALYASIYQDNNAFRNNATNFYNSLCTGGPFTVGTCSCSPGGDCGGHAITLVGWDDNYDAANFTTAAHGTPAGNGAFIAKNSWGTDSGASGYFYISYYDTSLGGETALFDEAEAADNYTTIYQYDPLGYTYRIGKEDIEGTGSLTEWMANIFTASADGHVRAAGFYTTDVNASYEIYVYTGVPAGSPRGGTLAWSGSGALAAAGYHTVPVAGNVPVSSGQRFSVVVKLTNSSDPYPVAVEANTQDWATPQSYSSGATAAAGQSYVSSNGSSWTDLTTVRDSHFHDDFYRSNVCLKAYADTDATPPSDVSAVYDGSAAGVDIDKTGSTTQLSANWTASSDPESGIARYDYAIGTYAGGTDVRTWTSNGTSLSATASGLSLTNGITYHFGVRAVNGLGLASAPAWSDGQMVDTTAPEDVPYVDDGIGYDLDYVTSLTSLSASWGASPSAGVTAYSYAIGTAPGGTGVLGWTSAGLSLSVTRSGLTLAENTTYYFSVRAYNGSSGYYSAGLSSDGQLTDTIAPRARVIVQSGLPAAGGPFTARLIVDEANALASDPVFYFTDSAGRRVNPELERVNSSTWTASAYVESYYSTGTATFHFSASDPAGNAGSSIDSGATFPIDLALSGAAGGLVSNSDGMAVSMPAGAAAGTYFVGISTVDAARRQSADSSSPDSSALYHYDLAREFLAFDAAGVPITSFSAPPTLVLAYPDADNDGRIDGDLLSESLAWIYYLDESAGRWVPLESVARDASANTLTAPVEHFSVYSVRVTASSAGGLGSLKAYPNPCDLRASSPLRVSGVPPDASAVKVYIYNSAGELVRTLSAGDGVGAFNAVSWDGRLAGGEKAASGLYIYLVSTSNYGKGTGKFYIVW